VGTRKPKTTDHASLLPTPSNLYEPVIRGAATTVDQLRNKRVNQAETRRFQMDLLRIIIAILLPPLGVFLQVGIGKQFFINVLLTILGYIPGIVHAVWVIAKY
jgi:uncharacterized membrane protein YqaE (UPF0057 family)